MSFHSLSDRHLLALLRTGKKNGARPFLKHPKVMIALRHEAEARALVLPWSVEAVQRINKVLEQMGEKPV